MKLRFPVSRSTKSIVLSAMLVLAMTGCATIPQFTDKPFNIDKDEFYRTVKVIALEPLALPNVKRAEQVRAEFESLVTEKLREAGFTTVPSNKFGALWDSLSKQEGGLYDPVSGKRDDAKMKEIRKRIMAELGLRYQADAVLRTAVIMTSAHFANCTARWHGTVQQIDACGAFGGGYYGNISALSLLVQIEGKEGNVLFRNAGGIQPKARLKTGFFKAAQFETIEDDALFTDTVKNRASVSIAIEPLVRRQTEQAVHK